MSALFVSWESPACGNEKPPVEPPAACGCLGECNTTSYTWNGLVSTCVFMFLHWCFVCFTIYYRRERHGEQETGNKGSSEQRLIPLQCISHISLAKWPKTCSLTLPTGPSFGPVERKRKEQGMFLNKLPRYFFYYFSRSFFIG